MYRLLRLAAHLGAGIATTTLVFPLLAPPRRKALIRRWSARLLAILRVEPRISGWPPGGLPHNLLIVANHVSWLDIFVLDAVQPARFVGKSELRRWPLAGRLIADCGTLFIERGRRRDAHRINEQARAALAAGDVIAVFPEGTTTDGTALLPFHGSLLQPVIDAQGHVQPVAIRYRGSDGAHKDAPAYVGETSFLESLWRILGERSMIVCVDLAPPLAARARHRRDLARDAEAAIRQALAPAAISQAPGTRDDRRA
ncbi:MAG: lysophospholipid acyltransferase family protein [Casimicrobiaceae bacterium]